MISSHLPLSLLLAVSFSAILAGCQSTAVLNKQQTTAVSTTSADDKSKPIDEMLIQESQVMQWSAHYDWQLAQVTNQNGNVVDIADFVPVTLQVEPSSVSFYQGCDQYRMDFHSMSAPPYPYYSHLGKVPATCNDEPDNEIENDKSIQSLFAKYAPIKLNFELLPTSNSTSETVSTNTQSAPKRLALDIENGNRLTFIGLAKPLVAPTGLPVTNELLEQYDWQLVSAVSNTSDEKGQLIRKSLGNFYHPDHPISASFESWPDSQYASFSSGCNSSRAPYFLLNDNTFNVGTIISTVMGCGETGNRIETALFKLMQDSSSKLTLSLQTKKLESETDFPRYNLLQTMVSGETLVWQNEIKDTP
ncbi:META domain-containing protein [Psychrobacter sp.]|uniref:META domain-containing protein n=1 Tax=Psychrobacter sp. TaxID=56811 RepID=UPI003BAEEE48